jgi:uncharacterized protein YqgC (DUF456 family)
MDIALAILAALLILVGLAGSILPVLPGPPLCWVGLLVLHFSAYAEFSVTFLSVMFGLMVVITVLDYFIPIWGTKRFGGTKAGVRGSIVGLVVGLFFGPLGIILGPFLGALVGELIVNQSDMNKALKSAAGSFVGFLLGTGIKLVYGGFTIWYYIAAVA